MNLHQAKQSLHEQEAATVGPPPPTNAPAPATLADITASDDIAPYPLPLGMRVIRQKSRKRQRRLKEAADDGEDEGHPQFKAILQAIAETAAQTSLGDMGFQFDLSDEALVMKARTGRRFFFRQFFGQIVMTLEEADVFWWEPVGILTEIQPYMAWELPAPEEEIFVENVAWRICMESIPYIIKLEAQMTLGIFTDFSITSPLDESTLTKIQQFFTVIPPGTFSGGQQLLDLYIKQHGRLNEDTVYFQPLNAWGSRYVVDQDIPKMLATLQDTKVQGHAPVLKEWQVSWGDVARLRIYKELPSILEVRYEDGSGRDQWCCVHVAPCLPARMEDEYMAEVLELLPSLKILTPSDLKIDMPDMLKGLWETNADQGGLGLGYAYYRDGQWGIDYANTGMGQGNPDSASPNTSITGFRWNEQPDGLIRMVVDPTASANVTKRVPSVSVLDLLFHPSLGVEKMIDALSRYTYCT